MADIERLARAAGLVVHPPTGGSHHKVESVLLRRQLVVPYNRPIGAVYVRLLVRLLDDHVGAGGGGGHA